MYKSILFVIAACATFGSITTQARTPNAGAPSANQQYAMIGGHEGNGGDICEDRVKTIRDDISSWLSRGGANALNLPSGIQAAQFASGMQTSIRSALISCPTSPVYIGRAEKTCVNFVDGSGQRRIQCNAARFVTLPESDQYVLIHHEYAGLAGFEVNDGESSQYSISNQISSYLEDTVVKRLAVKEPATRAASPLLGRWVWTSSNQYGSLKVVRVISENSTKITISCSTGLFGVSGNASILVATAIKGNALFYLTSAHDEQTGSRFGHDSRCFADITAGEASYFIPDHGRLFEADESGNYLRMDNGNLKAWTR